MRIYSCWPWRTRQGPRPDSRPGFNTHLESNASGIFNSFLRFHWCHNSRPAFLLQRVWWHSFTFSVPITLVHVFVRNVFAFFILPLLVSTAPHRLVICGLGVISEMTTNDSISQLIIWLTEDQLFNYLLGLMWQ